MCTAAELSASDTVLEIGPGLGTLTTLLVDQSHEVVAVEFDKDLADALPKRVAADNLQVVQADILRFNLNDMSSPYKVVANIPYYLTSNLIRVLSEAPNAPSAVVLLVQQEVAQRVVAQPGAMSVLSVVAQLYWQVSLGREVGAALFTPPPKVNSQILVLKRHSAPLFPEMDTALYLRIVKAGFSQRRKTLLNSLSAGLHMNRADTEICLDRAGIKPTERAQALSLKQWYGLCMSYSAR